MLKITIPGSGDYQIDNLLLDYNGTIGLDGKLMTGVAECVTALADVLEVHVVTADTFGSAASELEGLPLTLHILAPFGEAKQKKTYAEYLGLSRTICIGNGKNDIMMIEAARLGIAVIGSEGCCAKLIPSADIVTGNILEALELLIHPRRLVATLRE